MSHGRCKGHITTRCNLHFFKIESDGPCLRWVESFPGCHVGLQSTRQERRWYIEHQNVRVVIRANSGQVFVSHGLGPLGDQLSESRFIVTGVPRTRHGLIPLPASIPILMLFGRSAWRGVSKRAMSQTAGDVAIDGKFLVRMGNLKKLEDASSCRGKPKLRTGFLGNSVQVEQRSQP
jgi:hypothetical protein